MVLFRFPESNGCLNYITASHVPDTILCSLVYSSLALGYLFKRNRYHRVHDSRTSDLEYALSVSDWLNLRYLSSRIFSKDISPGRILDMRIKWVRSVVQLGLSRWTLQRVLVHYVRRPLFVGRRGSHPRVGPDAAPGPGWRCGAYHDGYRSRFWITAADHHVGGAALELIQWFVNVFVYFLNRGANSTYTFYI